MPNMDWVDSVNTGGDNGYFKIQEGDNKIQLLSHLAPYALKWNGSRYVPAEDGEEGVSHKGVGWVLQDGVIKNATLPYTVVRAIKDLMQDEDYAFSEFPMPRLINIKAKNAGTKEVEYSVVPSPKETEVSEEILAQLKEKLSPEEFVEKMRAKEKTEVSQDVKPEDIPF